MFDQRAGSGALSVRLDEAKLDQLRTWGAGLATAANQELRATGKAILLLIEEIEALHVELWNERARVPEPESVSDEDAAEAPMLHETLRARLRRLTPRPSRGDG